MNCESVPRSGCIFCQLSLEKTGFLCVLNNGIGKGYFMNTFWLKVVNLILLAGLLLGYNAVVNSRMQQETIDRMQAELETVKRQEERQEEEQPGEGSSDASPYEDGEFEGSAQGFGGLITVNVTIENGMLTDITIVSAANEDRAYLEMASAIVNEILEKQTDQVDTVSGATFSSTGIRNAVTDALDKAKK